MFNVQQTRSILGPTASPSATRASLQRRRSTRVQQMETGCWLARRSAAHVRHVVDCIMLDFFDYYFV